MSKANSNGITKGDVVQGWQAYEICLEALGLLDLAQDGVNDNETLKPLLQELRRELRGIVRKLKAEVTS